MIPLLHDTVDWINDLLRRTFQGAYVFGIARSAVKDDTLMPVVGEQFVGIDTSYPMIAYHKHNSITSKVVRGGYGDVEGYHENTHNMSLILYFDETQCKKSVDEVFTFIQLQVSGILKSGENQVRINVSNAILDDGQLWVSEYGNAEFPLHVSQRLISIGYSVTIALDKTCITIPNCKN